MQSWRVVKLPLGMTLILACLTPTHVFLVSDRRLTSLNGPSPGSIIEEDSNKAVIYEGHVAFGYTGLAELSGDRTDLWLAKTLGEAPDKRLPLPFEHLRSEATKEFRALTIDRRYRRHAFLGVGWTVPGPSEELVATSVLVENMYDVRGRVLDDPQEEFKMRVEVHRKVKNGFRLQSVGATVNPGQRNAILRFVGRPVKRQAPQAILRALLISVRWMADYHPTVGRTLMGLCVPKAAVQRIAATGQTFTLFGSTAATDISWFVYLGPDGSTTYYGPTSVGGGWVMSNPTVKVGS